MRARHEGCPLLCSGRLELAVTASQDAAARRCCRIILGALHTYNIYLLNLLAHTIRTATRSPLEARILETLPRQLPAHHSN
ncbi:hypothetical protein TgHK011_004660 [Trichoderma gracile]|nr:hypothetical protein TgHK011_004660 [Trichoderma gracile]